MRSARRLSGIFFLLALSGMILLAVCLMYPSTGENDALQGEYVRMEESSLLTIIECDGYTVVDVANPWGKGRLQRYLLVPSSGELPRPLPAGTVVRTPVENALLFSGVHVALLKELGASECVKAVCDAEYIYSGKTAAAIRSGEVVDCGSSLDIDIERVAQASPDAAFVLPFENGGYGKLGRTAIPLIECADYMEGSPLACAEWMRFYGRLVGRGAAADSLFYAVYNEYISLAYMAARDIVNPKMMCGLKGSSAWYVPAEGSTMGQMYSDAGAVYPFNYEGTGSVPLSYETVLDLAADADIWLIKYNSPVELTYASMLEDFGGYAHFRAFKEKNVYACNTRNKRIFEECVFHPERLLEELVVLFHPHLYPLYELRYYEKLR